MRRRFKSKTGVPLTKKTDDIARNRGFQKPSETGKAKRVRFDDAETNASFRGDEATQSPKCGGPKTSEYAYFRKVKEGAVNGYSRALHKDNEHLKSSKLSYLHRETHKAAEKLDPDIKDLEFRISGESAGPSGRKLFVSPPVRIFDESNELIRKELAYKTKQRSPLLPETATPVRQSLLNQTTEKSENQCIEKGFFSEKRKRLRQWVAQTTSSEVEKLHEKGSDLISFLLLRLIPKGNENNDSSKENAKISSKSLTVHQSDNLKGLSLPDKRDCHKELPEISSERSREIVPREWDNIESGFPSDYQKDGDLRKNMDHSRRRSEIVLGEWDSFESGFPSNYHKGGELRTNIVHSRRSSEGVLREWDSFESIFPSDYQKDDELRKRIDHSGRSNEIVLREWDSSESAFPSNYLKDGELRTNMDHSRRSCESVPREWDSFESEFPCDYQKGGELQKYMDHCERSNEIVLREWDNPHSRFPSNCHKQSKLQNKSMHPDEHSKSRIYNRSDTHHGFSFCLPFERFRSLGAFHFKDLDEFHPVVEHVREEPSRHSLEWVFELGKDRPDCDTRQAVCHRPPNAWGPNQQGVLDNMLNANGFPASPLFARRSLVEPLPEYVRTACLMDEDQQEFGDVKEPQRPNKVWDCVPHSDSWRNCLAASEFSAEDHQSGYHAWQFPQNEKGLYSLALLKASTEEPFASHYEGASNHYLLPSTLHSPLDTFMNCPLLLNDVSHDSILDQVLYSDDYDN